MVNIIAILTAIGWEEMMVPLKSYVFACERWSGTTFSVGDTVTFRADDKSDYQIDVLEIQIWSDCETMLNAIDHAKIWPTKERHEVMADCKTRCTWRRPFTIRFK
jgi:hypothetical protein